MKRNELFMAFIIDDAGRGARVLNSIFPACTSSPFFAEMPCRDRVLPRLERLWERRLLRRLDN